MKHTVHFSHEFEAGPSGPARAYFDIRRGASKVATVCLHPRRDMSLLTAQAIAYALDEAWLAGAAAKARDLRDALGVR